MVIGYWSVAILFWQLSIDHIVNVQCKRCGLVKTRLRHPSFPFDSLPYPPVQSVDAYVRSVSHVTTKRKEVDHNLWVWGSVPRALRARRSPAIISRITISGSRKSYCSTLGTVLRQKAELWRPSLKIIKSDSGKTQDHYVWDTHKSSLTVRQNRWSIGDW